MSALAKIFCLLLLSPCLYAQQPVNPGFEEWLYDESETPFIHLGPAGWQCNCIPVINKKQSSVNTFVVNHSGLYSALMFTNTSTEDGSLRLSWLSQSIPLHGRRPEKVRLYAYMTYQNSEAPFVEILVKNGNRVIGSGKHYFKGYDESIFEEVNVPVSYREESICDSIIIRFQTSTTEAPDTWNNTLAIDDVSILYQEPRLEISMLYPNPANSFNTLSFYNPEHRLLSIDLYEMSGRFVKTVEYTLQEEHGSVSIDCSALNEGLYFYSISSGTQQFIRKFAVQHGKQ